MIVHLSGPWAIVINITVWLIIHVVVGMSTARIRPESFNPESWLYRQRTWEGGGKTYRSFLKVKKWKRFLPDGVAVFKGGLKKGHFDNTHASYVQRYILETCRAELTHWVILPFALIFFVWSDWWIGLIMVAYALADNVPCIIAQRYNRIRLKRLHERYNRG